MTHSLSHSPTAILKIIEGLFQVFQGFFSSKLVLKAVESCFVALNYHESGSSLSHSPTENTPHVSMVFTYKYMQCKITETDRQTDQKWFSHIRMSHLFRKSQYIYIYIYIYIYTYTHTFVDSPSSSHMDALPRSALRISREFFLGQTHHFITESCNSRGHM